MTKQRGSLLADEGAVIVSTRIESSPPRKTNFNKFNFILFHLHFPQINNTTKGHPHPRTGLNSRVNSVVVLFKWKRIVITLFKQTEMSITYQRRTKRSDCHLQRDYIVIKCKSWSVTMCPTGLLGSCNQIRVDHSTWTHGSWLSVPEICC